MSIAQVVAGAYTSTYNAVALTGNVASGQTSAGAIGTGLGFNDDNGYELEMQTHGEMIDRTDLYGQSLLDWIHQGGSVFCTFTSMTFQNLATGIKNAFYPWGAFGVMAGPGIPIGRLASRVAMPLVLTAVTGTPAQTATGAFNGVPPGVAPGPLTLTAPLAILPPGSNLRLMYATRVRKVPCRMALLPYDQSTLNVTDPYTRWWSET